MRYSMLSAGAGSYRAAKLDRLLHPDAPFRMVFTDTLYEDADAYRFLIEGAADIVGRKLNWIVRAEDFPDYRVSEDVPIEEYCGNPDWRAFLADLRERTASAIPELIWLTEGRDIWEIARDRRFLVNSQRDPCSETVKRKLFGKWRDLSCRKDRDTFLVGIDEAEAHRFDDGEGNGIRPRMAKAGWNYEAPLIEVDRLIQGGGRVPDGAMTIAYSPLEAFGPRPGRQYAFGYKHDNCGGACGKGGMAHWQNRFEKQPDRYAYDEMMEAKIGDYLGRKVSMLTDRRGGKKRPMTLREFAARLRASPSLRYEYEPGSSGCGCMLDAA
jgi:hypothetical protein